MSVVTWKEGCRGCLRMHRDAYTVKGGVYVHAPRRMSSVGGASRWHHPLKRMPQRTFLTSR